MNYCLGVKILYFDGSTQVLETFKHFASFLCVGFQATKEVLMWLYGKEKILQENYRN